MTDAVSGGVIANKTPQATRDLNSIMVANSQQFGFRQDSSSSRVNEVHVSNLEQQISFLSSLVQQMAWESMQQVKPCEICVAHFMRKRILLKDFLVHHKKNDHFSDIYNSGW